MITPISYANYRNNIVAFKAQNPVIKEAISTSRMLTANGYGRSSEQDYYNFLNSEINELKAAKANEDYKNMQEEIGDILFDTIMIADYYGINPSKALAETNKKISDRVKIAKKIASKPLTDFPIEQRLIFWDIAKQELKKKQ